MSFSAFDSVLGVSFEPNICAIATVSGGFGLVKIVVGTIADGAIKSGLSQTETIASSLEPDSDWTVGPRIDVQRTFSKAGFLGGALGANAAATSTGFIPSGCKGSTTITLSLAQNVDVTVTPSTQRYIPVGIGSIAAPDMTGAAAVTDIRSSRTIFENAGGNSANAACGMDPVVVYQFGSITSTADTGKFLLAYKSNNPTLPTTGSQDFKSVDTAAIVEVSATFNNNGVASITAAQKVIGNTAANFFISGTLIAPENKGLFRLCFVLRLRNVPPSKTDF